MGTTPKPEYLYLQQLFESTNGNRWFNNENWNFSNYELYNPCQQDWFGVYVDVSSCNVTKVLLSHNNLSGILPPVVSNLTSLLVFDISDNSIAGKLPLFRNAPDLVQLSFDVNQFSGTIADDLLDDSTGIEMLWFSANINNLVGTLPKWLFNHTTLLAIHLGGNLLDGTISPSIGEMTDLGSFMVFDNQLYGSIPTSISELTNMYILLLELNDFSGPVLDLVFQFPEITILALNQNSFSGTFPDDTIPHYEFTNTNLKLSDNYFTGSITDYYCYFDFKFFNIDRNMFSGTFPSSCAMEYVLSVVLAQNLFTGSLENIFPIDDYPSLSILLLGYNSFSGTIPPELFQLPSLRLLSAPQNCFHGSLSEDICTNISSTINSINLSGLRSSPTCSIKLFKSYFSPSMKGSIPSCIWQLPNISSLFISGNGYTGTIPNNISHTLTSDLSLSHNYFTGTIPSTILQRSFEALDLSYNKFRGSIDAVNDLTLINSESFGYWNISNNRISGRLSTVFHNAHSIDVLYGNVFQCNKDLPTQDPNINNYFCGSSQLEYSTYSFSGVVFLLLIAFFYVFKKFFHLNFTSDLISTFSKDGIMKPFVVVCHTLSQNDHLKSLQTPNKEKVEKFFEALDFISRLMFFCAVYVILLLLPTYLILNTVHESFRKYQFEYGWVQSTVYLTGLGPGIVLLLLFCLFIFLLLIKIPVVVQPETSPKDGKSTEESRSENEERTSWWNFIPMVYHLLYIIIFLVNVSVSILVNVGYLISLSEDSGDHFEYLIQISMAIYKIIWDSLILEYALLLLSRFGEASRLRLLLLVFNTILGPCIAVIITGGSCFQELFVQPSEVVVYNDVMTGYSVGSIYYSESNETATYQSSSQQLPFMYYFSCGSQTLTSFIPVFLYQYSFLPIQNFIKLFVVAKWEIKYIPEFMKKMILGILRPHDYELFPKFIDEDSIYSSLLAHFFTLVTFGINCPLLAIMIIIVILLDALSWKYLIMQFINSDKGLALSNVLFIEQASGKDEITRVELINSQLKGNLFESLFHLRWIIFYCCLTFNALILFDIVGDQQGWFIAFFFPVSIIAFIIIAHISVFSYERCRYSRHSSESQDDPAVNIVENPLYHEERKSKASRHSEIELENGVGSKHSIGDLSNNSNKSKQNSWSNRPASDDSSNSNYGSALISGFGSFGLSIDRNKSRSKERNSEKTTNCIVQ
jgi:hypothetical protein